MSIRYYLLSKLFFPGTVVVSNPGVIYSETVKRYSPSVRKRLMYVFEDIFAGLETDTPEAARLWYRIGTRVGEAQLSMAGAKKLPDILFADLLKYVIENFRAAGGGCAECFSVSSKEISGSGKNNIICRKTSIPDFNLGTISAVASYLSGREFEARSLCNACPDHCGFELTRTDKPYHYPATEKYLESRRMEQEFFAEHSLPMARDSFQEYINFKKIHVEENGMICFTNGLYVFPIPPVVLGIVSEEYEKEAMSGLLCSSLRKSIDAISEKMFCASDKTEKRIGILKSYFSVLGWGSIEVHLLGTRIRIAVRDAPREYTESRLFSQICTDFVCSAMGRYYALKKHSYPDRSTLRIELEAAPGCLEG